MVIAVKNATYGANAQGYINWRAEFMARSGITSPTQMTAIETLYQNALSANIWSKLLGVCFFPGATAATQKNVFREDKGTLAFAGGTTHSATGFQPNTAEGLSGRADTGFILPADLTNFSFGVYNRTSEIATNSSAPILMGVTGEGTAGNVADYDLRLSRSLGTGRSTYGALSQRNGGNAGAPIFPTSYDATKKGLIQLVKTGNVFNLLDGPVAIKTQTISTFNNPIGGGTHTLTLGALTTSTGGFTGGSTAGQAFAYWGTLNLAEALVWQTIVDSFVTAFGRAA